MASIDEEYWTKNLKLPDWYIKLSKEINNLFVLERHNENKRIALRLVERLLKENKVEVGIKGPNFDEERCEIDTIVVHHTAGKVSSLDQLSAIGLLRLYVPDYLENKGLGHMIRGKRIWSGHFMQGKQVFYPYHWLVRPDGSTERLLEDHYIGWHAGDWAVNRRSIGIALDGDYEKKNPTKNQLKGLINLIKKSYPNVTRKRIFGHSEIVETLCPGAEFENGWKIEIIKSLGL